MTYHWVVSIFAILSGCFCVMPSWMTLYLVMPVLTLYLVMPVLTLYLVMPLLTLCIVMPLMTLHDGLLDSCKLIAGCN